MPEKARLKVNGHGEVEVDLVAAYLTDLKRAYDSILTFEAVTAWAVKAASENGRSESAPEWQYLDWSPDSYFRDWPPTTAQIASIVPNTEHSFS